ncbi:hypothetical protein L218DRAFT_905097 [Marasmius fiardii PR-910]|nr:hypothetical protein L218DRAFT_905097 [Marasmius fiardii PR-910]
MPAITRKRLKHTLSPANRFGDSKTVEIPPYSILRWSFGRGSVVWTVWPSVSVHTLFATLVVALTMKTNVELAIPSVMLTVLGVVLGFVISYRALSGYDRYYAGRTAWGDIIRNCRVMGRLIWYHVPPCMTPRTPQEQESGKLKRSKVELAKVMAEKRSALDLIEGFAVSVKHHLRGESGIYYDDLYPLVKPLHPESLKLQTASHFVSVTNSSQYDVDLLPVVQTPLNLQARTNTVTHDPEHPGSEVTASSHLEGSSAQVRGAQNPSPRETSLRHTRSDSKKWNVPLPPKPENKTHKIRPKLPGTGDGANLPLEILRCLSEWLSVLEERGTVPGTSMGSLIGSVATFEDSLGALEKTLAVPLPFVLSIHINTVWVYLFFLPFQLVKMFQWYSIPGATIAAFIYLGFVAAGEELEQPFGYDSNDLDLDFFCKEIVRVDISRLKRSLCLNSWFSHRWKERILKEGRKEEERWKRPLAIRKGIVDLDGEVVTEVVSPLHATSRPTGRLRSKTISEAAGSMRDAQGPDKAKGKVHESESSDSHFDDTDDTDSSSDVSGEDSSLQGDELCSL